MCGFLCPRYGSRAAQQVKYSWLSCCPLWQAPLAVFVLTFNINFSQCISNVKKLTFDATARLSSVPSHFMVHIISPKRTKWYKCIESWHQCCRDSNFDKKLRTVNAQTQTNIVPTHFITWWLPTWRLEAETMLTLKTIAPTLLSLFNDVTNVFVHGHCFHAFAFFFYVNTTKGLLVFTTLQFLDGNLRNPITGC